MRRHHHGQGAMQREAASDYWIQRNVPGGLNSPLGRAMDNYLGGNPNPTPGQMYGGNPYGGGGGYGYGNSYGNGYGNGYGYPQRRW